MSNKVLIKIDSNAEQQESLKNSRKTLKVLQNKNSGVDKENFAGRSIQKFFKGKIDSQLSSNDSVKRKKLESQSTQTETEKNSITAEDLTTTDSPSEAFWERLADKRRDALEESLIENHQLHDRIDGLEDELNTSRQMLEEAKNLIEVLQEIMAEQEDDLNKGASTSGSCEDVEVGAE